MKKSLFLKQIPLHSRRIYSKSKIGRVSTLELLLIQNGPLTWMVNLLNIGPLTWRENFLNCWAVDVERFCPYFVFFQGRWRVPSYWGFYCRNAIEKIFQKKKKEQQRLKKRFLELPRESKNSSTVFFFFFPKNETKAYWKFQRISLWTEEFELEAKKN